VPATGNSILLDGTIDVDAGVVTGATSITSTSFVGELTGSCTGTVGIQRQFTHHMIKDNIGTSAPVYISLGEIDAESGTISNKNLPLLAPVAGKLLKIFVRSTTDMSGADLTFSLLTRAVSGETGGNAAVIGAKTGDGPDDSEMVTYDFTTGLDSGVGSETNVINLGDKVLISVISDTSVGDSNYFITCLWEWNLGDV